MKSSNKRIYLSPPHMSGKEQEYINEAFATNWIAPLGPNVNAFEQELAKYVGAEGAVALSAGTAAMHLGLRLLGVGAGDIVFCSSFTFIGSVNPILYLNAEPVFIDSEPESWNMSPVALQRAFNEAERIGRMPKAVVVVNLYGQSADMQPILKICNKYGVPVMEDAAESLGTSYNGKMSGTWGRFGAFSFNGNKIITTSGGGALVSDDLEALEKARFWATQARDPAPYYQHTEMGYNYRMSNILAGIGRAQLEVLNQRVETRRAIFKRYYEQLHDMECIGFMPEPSYGKANRWLTVMTLNPEVLSVTPDQIIAALEAENIESRRVWKPMHLQPMFKDNPYYTHEDDKSVCDWYFYNGVCLPSGSSLSVEEQQRVVECVRRCL
jgi:pyridoxal phosphate-dependent aminotransferase EpsN